MKSLAGVLVLLQIVAVASMQYWPALSQDAAMNSGEVLGRLRSAVGVCFKWPTIDLARIHGSIQYI